MQQTPEFTWYTISMEMVVFEFALCGLVCDISTQQSVLWQDMFENVANSIQGCSFALYIFMFGR